MSTADRRLIAGPPSDSGYRAVVEAPGEQHGVTDDAILLEHWRERARLLLTFVHLSDLHIMDAQSPGRLELLDRFADPDSPWRRQLPSVGSYRAQEAFTTQVAEAMVQSINRHPVGPVSGAPVDLAVVTGDMTDNAQVNELRNCIGLLDGRTEIRPGSGDPDVWEGVGGTLDGDERYWHPEGDVDDLPWRRFGFPIVDDVLAAATRPFVSTGLTVPWLAVHGNHDNLVQGTVPSTGRWATAASGTTKPVTPSVDLDPVAVVDAVNACDPLAFDMLEDSAAVEVTPDPERRHVSRSQHVLAHLESPGQPRGHGYTPHNLATGTTHYVWETGRVRCVMLDTVNAHGGWQGCIDREQFTWLVEVLEASSARPVILFSHHPLDSLINDRCPAGTPPPVLAAELRETLLRFPCVVAWFNGHTHRHRVTAERDASGKVGFWQITTASHIDWPQQSRIVEMLEVDEQLVIASTIVDTDGSLDWQGRYDTLALAGLSREIAANDWQKPAGSARDGSGDTTDRNIIVSLPIAGRFKIHDVEAFAGAG